MKRFFLNSAVVLMTLASSLAVLPAATANAAACDGQTFLFPRWYDDLCTQDNEIMSPNDLGGEDTDNLNSNGEGTTTNTANRLGGWLAILARNLVTILLTAVGYVSLGFVIYGGFRYMTSGDSSSGTQAARKTITNALIGLVISIMAVAIVKFVAGVWGG